MSNRIIEIPFLKSPEKIRFWKSVDKSPGFGPNGDCWEWVANKTPKGYGTFVIKKTFYRSHRVSFFLKNGPIHGDLLVLHSCDNPGCVNPGHLFTGDNQKNMDDMMEKGRRNPPCGERAGSTKLTASQVLDIRSRYKKAGYNCKIIADEFGVTAPHINNIVKRRKWKHLKPMCPECNHPMLMMNGSGWDYDRWMCPVKGCHGEVELETSTEPTETGPKC